MATNVKPTILIVHGGWHVPKNYEKLATALESQGYEVHVPRLPSTNGARPPNADLFTDIDHVHNYAESLVRAGRRVMGIMHSYGGHVGSGAFHGLGLETRSAKGLKGGVSHLIYMTAYAVPEGISMMDKVDEFGNNDLVPLVFDFAEDKTCLYRDPKGMVGAGPSEAEVQEYVDCYVRWNGTGMYQASKQPAAWRDIPTSYIFTTSDMTVPFDYQKNFVEDLRQAGREVQTFEIDTAHCPHFTTTDSVVDIVNKVVGV
ncbi:Alpha/beta hydrolase fold-1 [Xylariaceae sp. FL0804]|nr:Alpha/beta hydrolase fold-1 [Xylariaceae sp. FL0804]